MQTTPRGLDPIECVLADLLILDNLDFRDLPQKEPGLYDWQSTLVDNESATPMPCLRCFPHRPQEAI
ncbi:MAG TPA: hypothetical protein VLK65_26940 [Vicinamibacteria bacterium]|nr:hypothetical protein [Vicinamibacteria bacterium]